MRFCVLRHLKTGGEWVSVALITVNPDHISQRLEVIRGPDLSRLPPHWEIHTAVITETSPNEPADWLDHYLSVCVCVRATHCTGEGLIGFWTQLVGSGEVTVMCVCTSCPCVPVQQVTNLSALTRAGNCEDLSVLCVACVCI